MRFGMRFREVEEIREDKQERSLPYFPDQIRIKPEISREEADRIYNSIIFPDQIGDEREEAIRAAIDKLPDEITY